VRKIFKKIIVLNIREAYGNVVVEGFVVVVVVVGSVVVVVGVVVVVVEVVVLVVVVDFVVVLVVVERVVVVGLVVVGRVVSIVLKIIKINFLFQSFENKIQKNVDLRRFTVTLACVLFGTFISTTFAFGKSFVLTETKQRTSVIV
jgi:hypothetical protein